MNKLLTVAVLTLLLPTLAAAQMGRGQRELTLSGAGSSSTDFDGGNVSATGEYGVYLTPRIEVGIRQSLGWSTGPSDTSWSGATRVYSDYHFGTAQWRPYLGGNIGGLYGDDTESTWAAGPELGIKYYVQPAAFLFAQFEYQIFFSGASEVSSSIDQGAFFYSFGAGYNF